MTISTYGKNSRAMPSATRLYRSRSSRRLAVVLGFRIWVTARNFLKIRTGTESAFCHDGRPHHSSEQVPSSSSFGSRLHASSLIQVRKEFIGNGDVFKAQTDRAEERMLSVRWLGGLATHQFSEITHNRFGAPAMVFRGEFHLARARGCGVAVVAVDVHAGKPGWWNFVSVRDVGTDRRDKRWLVQHAFVQNRCAGGCTQRNHVSGGDTLLHSVTNGDSV